ncbi:MBL fold metallo-hydrolase [Actinokineospora pegani]|uniref:MBL fold metallo-hydrolase n=1 Tax=Actinokineospora pegani TaxID=2654637 RepID=UPI0012E9AD78|nr:MBL fold metallo-hydrolase [Actinokineospora pegani]
MRVHHLDCGPMRPFGGSLLDGGPGGPARAAALCCHVLLVESPDGLVLVDTGMSRGDLANPPGTLGRQFRMVARPLANPAHAAVEQIRGLGLDPAEVAHVLLTHMDLDHAGGLPDFPKATVHVLGDEFRAATARRTVAEKARYVPAQWAHQPAWRLHEPTGGDTWFGFDAVAPAAGLPDGFALVPLVGHTRGHAGIAVESDGGWLLHAGDAYFHHGALEPEPSVPPLLRVFEARMQTLGEQRRHNQARLRELVAAHGDEVTVFSAHDQTELDRLRAH